MEVNWAHPVNRGRVSWWPMIVAGGGTLRDIIGPNHGTLTNMGMDDWQPGIAKGHRSLNFDGSNDYVDVGDSDSLHISVGSIQFWYKATTADAEDMILSKDGVGHSHGDTVFTFDAQDDLIFRTNTGSGIRNTGGTAASRTTLGKWHFVVGVCSGSTIYLYFDGKLADSTSASDQLFGTHTEPLEFGARSRSSLYYDGLLADVSIWNRALSAAAVRFLHKESRQGYPNLFRRRRRRLAVKAPAATATITGTATASIDEDDVVTGGKTIIITLTGDTFKAAGTGPIGSIADSNALLAGIDSAQSELTGWDNEVKANLTVSDLNRDSSTQATVTLPSAASYDITAQETITVTVPTDVLVTAAGAIVGSPTFTVDVAGAITPISEFAQINQPALQEPYRAIPY